MLLNWSNPPELDAPRRRWTRQLNSDRVNLVRLQQSRAKGPKKHSTNKERSLLERTKVKELTARNASRDEAREVFKAKVRAYWSGGIDAYPQS